MRPGLIWRVDELHFRNGMAGLLPWMSNSRLPFSRDIRSALNLATVQAASKPGLIASWKRSDKLLA